MNVRIEVTDGEDAFVVRLIDEDKGVEVLKTGWEGDSFFTVDGEHYALLGPYHEFPDYKLFKLVPIEAKVLTVDSKQA